MNELYSEVEHTKNCWDYGEGVGIIGKNRIGTVKDKEQDEKIVSNKEEIDKTKESLEDNENRDDAQQEQIDANKEAIERNDEVDRQQQEQIDANKTALEDNESRDDAQQVQINELNDKLNENIESDAAQQSQINENTTQIINNKEDIIKIKDELPTLEIENTTLIIGKKGGS